MLGFSYDWDRELATTDVDYFRWTQWIFLQLFDTWFDAAAAARPADQRAADSGRRRGRRATTRSAAIRTSIAWPIRSEAPVNWCPALGTVLANEEVIDGKSERGGHPVVRMPLRQWMLRITAYADRLENDLDTLDWSEGIKALQRNWIGRSTGAEVDFFIGREPRRRTASRRRAEFKAWRNARADGGFPRTAAATTCFAIYTTRPDTLFGATYMVLAPEHPFVERLTPPEQADGGASLLRAGRAQERSRPHRSGQGKDRRLHRLVRHQSGQRRPVPIWIADYVLISYGTGAIMAVPAHDERDFEFAQQFDLPIVPVVDPGDRLPASIATTVLAGKAVFAGDGDGDQLRHVQRPADGRVQREDHRRPGRSRARAARPSTTSCATGSSAGSTSGASRFRSCTSSTPTASRPACIRAVDAERLAGRPAATWTISSRTAAPSRRSSKRPHDWLYPTIDGKRYKRETNTMPQWAGSCWYYLRFLDPKNDQALDRSARSKKPGCRSISTSAAPSMPCCTCSTRASGTRCSSTAASSARPSRFRSSSTRE